MRTTRTPPLPVAACRCFRPSLCLSSSPLAKPVSNAATTETPTLLASTCRCLSFGPVSLCPRWRFMGSRRLLYTGALLQIDVFPFSLELGMSKKPESDGPIRIARRK